MTGEFCTLHYNHNPCHDTPCSIRGYSAISDITRNINCPNCGEKSKRLRTWKPDFEPEDASVYYHYRQCKACGEKFGVRITIERQIMPWSTVDAIRKRYGGKEPTAEQLAAFWLDEDTDN